VSSSISVTVAPNLIVSPESFNTSTISASREFVFQIGDSSYRVAAAFISRRSTRRSSTP
jgi:hypothetical protein